MRELFAMMFATFYSTVTGQKLHWWDHHSVHGLLWPSLTLPRYLSGFFFFFFLQDIYLALLVVTSLDEPQTCAIGAFVSSPVSCSSWQDFLDESWTWFDILSFMGTKPVAVASSGLCPHWWGCLWLPAHDAWRNNPTLTLKYTSGNSQGLNKSTL